MFVTKEEETSIDKNVKNAKKGKIIQRHDQFSHTKITLLVNKNGILSILGVKFIAVDCQSICEGELLFSILWRKNIIMRVLARTGADLYPSRYLCAFG